MDMIHLKNLFVFKVFHFILNKNTFMHVNKPITMQNALIFQGHIWLHIIL